MHVYVYLYIRVWVHVCIYAGMWASLCKYVYVYLEGLEYNYAIYIYKIYIDSIPGIPVF